MEETMKLVESIPGVSLQVLRGNKAIDLRRCNEGCLGQFVPGELILLTLRVLPIEGVIRTLFALQSGRNGNSILSPKKRAQNGYYYHSVPILSGMTGVLHTKYPENHVKLLGLTTQGAVTLWEIAVVSEHGTFFLTTQMTYTTTCYRDAEGNAVCPLVESSLPIRTAIRSVLKGRTETLPPIEDYHRHPQDMRNTALLALPRNVGLVMWWNEAMRVGMLRTAEEQGVRALGNNIQTQRNHRTFLVPGECVYYKRLKPTTGKTRFKFDATAITM